MCFENCRFNCINAYYNLMIYKQIFGDKSSSMSQTFLTPIYKLKSINLFGLHSLVIGKYQVITSKYLFIQNLSYLQYTINE